jgi:hypothetical protein
VPNFRSKSVVISAIQFIPGETDDIPGIEWDHGGFPFIRTLEGCMRISPQDWIVTGTKGEKYPCKPDIFETKYELVENV